MPSWVSEHRSDIQFVVAMSIGVVLVVAGLIRGDAAVVTLGSGAIGLPGFMEATGDES